jgi:quinol monooxygenase YgiN
MQLTDVLHFPNPPPATNETGNRDGRSIGARLGEALCWRLTVIDIPRNSMLKHIVMWKLKDHAEGADRAANAIEMKRRLEECANIAPGTLKFEVALAQPGLEATYDVVLYAEFADRAALQAYIDHPTHKAVVPFIGAIREGRQCMDYEI